MKSMVKIVCLLTIILFEVHLLCAQNNTFYEYEMLEFDFKGHPAKIVFPKEANKERLWIWRARFWGHEPQTDLALLEKGFHVAYVDVANLFGNNEAVSIWNKFYSYLIDEYKLHPKVVLEGMSRGGLIVYNWAAANVEKVASIYADAPVCDIKSWPGGLYAGKGSVADWERCLNAYGLNDSTVYDFKGIPTVNAIKLAQAGIPVLHVCGAADKVVPYFENTKILADNYKQAGGNIKVVLKNGVGHHPHSLEDPEVIVDFILDSF